MSGVLSMGVVVVGSARSRAEIESLGDRGSSLLERLADSWTATLEETAETPLDEWCSSQSDDIERRRKRRWTMRTILSDWTVLRCLDFENELDVLTSAEAAIQVPLTVDL